VYKGVTIIAEVKVHSPFGFVSNRTWEELFAIANGIGDILSIHTDPRWGGSFDLVARARSLTTKPILAKGIHALDSDIEAAVAAGADYVLVVGRMPGVHRDKCLVEPLTIAELSALPTDVRAVWNSRDLSDGGMKTETFADARKAFAGWLCQASNIRTVVDIEEGADAVLVGTNIEEFARSLAS
jgi:indole-3-glycerol phosphate synthase